MSLSNALHEECIQLGSRAANKASVLREIARLAKKSPALDRVDEDTIHDALRLREEIGTTGFGRGIAIPHCVLEEVDKFVVGILIHSEGVDFASVDGKVVQLFAFIIGSKSRRNEHIRLLSGISKVLNTEAAVQQLLSAKGPAAVRKIVLRHVPDEIEPSQQAERSVVHVFVQDAGKFEDILQVFSEIEGCSVSVVEANDAYYYLHSMPLFRGLRGEPDKGYNRIIVATVVKALANEVLRRILAIAGDLNQSAGIMIVVQDSLFSAGALNY